MARPSIWPPDAPSATGSRAQTQAQAGSHGHAPPPASVPPTNAATLAPSAQLGAAHRRTRSARHAQPTHHTSAVPADIGASDLTSIDVSQLHVETDSSDSDYRAARRPATGPSHSRSMSNPFPSLFSPKKKKSARDESPFGSGDSPSGAGSDLPSSKKRGGQQNATSSLAPPGYRRSDKTGFENGPCITCGSLMRWARGAEAFRCGICLTVNDLMPVEKILAATHATSSKTQDASSGPISVEQTKRIVSGCIRSYLEAVLPAADIVSSPVGVESNSTATAEIEAKRIFQGLEAYVIRHIMSMNSLDDSFLPTTHAGEVTSAFEEGRNPHAASAAPKNSFWRANTQDHLQPIRGASSRRESDAKKKLGVDASKAIGIDWGAVDEWYSTVINAGASWESVYNGLVGQGKCDPKPPVLLREVESCILNGQLHAQRVLLKATETVLKRPGRRIGEEGDFRFLIIALANPLLHAQCSFFTGLLQHDRGDQRRQHEAKLGSVRGTGPASGQHSVIIKRILGLLSNSPEKWHNQIITCFADLPEARFLQLKDLASGFLAYRLVRYNEKRDKPKPTTEASDSLVPKVPEGASAASFHAALNQATSTSNKNKNPADKKIVHGDDWQIKAAVRVLRLLFAANDITGVYRNVFGTASKVTSNSKAGIRGLSRRQIVPITDFYITLLDNCDLIADFEGWEQQAAKFAFCQYPFLLSIWAKIQILEYEARRQMKNKARDAFFDSIMTRRNFDQHLVLNIRRDCLVEDSLKGVSAAIGSGTDDIKKGLRIIFNGEEGIDAGGLRKEWFLLLVREVFNPDHGMFVYDEESHYCYFNSVSFETSDQFFLVGVVLGLAIYNSTILDVALPPFAFRKLLFAAPTPPTGALATSPRPIMTYALADLAEFRPHLAKGLQQLLDYDGDVESTFGLDFTIAVERFGHADMVPLCPGGESRAVSNANREEYVSLYIRYLLDTAVSRQFEPFKRGFFTVCGCNALGLFRPEEIELLVRGSDEILDVAALRLAASYENWPTANPVETEPTVKWFWEIFKEASPRDQRNLLIFITGSDRIPVTGPASLSIRILYLGDDTGRFPTARTCFNILTLYRYKSKEVMQAKLWGAVHGSEGFGLK